MNTVMRQYYEQDTDVVIVDTGDSYEGICSYFGGTYISYTKEKPISMNPFKITKMEYEQNFGEKKNFLKNLIFQIYKGASQPSMLEETIINQTIVEYYEAYFHPFEGFTDEEREKMKDAILLQDKANGKYEEYEQKMEERYGEEFNLELTENRELSEKISAGYRSSKPSSMTAQLPRARRNRQRKPFSDSPRKLLKITILCVLKENWRRWSDRRRS